MARTKKGRVQLGFEKAVKEAAAKADIALTDADLKERNLGGLENYPVTPAAHAWLKNQSFGKKPLHKVRPVWLTLVEAAKQREMQLVLDETKTIANAKVEELKSERQELYDQRPDEGAPSQEMTCSFPELRDGEKVPCGNKFQPMSWNMTRFDRDEHARVIVYHTAGPLEGKPKRLGNFAISKDDEEPRAIGPCHTDVLKEARVRTYTYEEAVYQLRRSEVRDEGLSDFIDRRDRERRDDRRGRFNDRRRR